MQQPSYVGIDVSRHRLDVALPGVSKVWRTPNDADGIAAPVRRIRRLRVVPNCCVPFPA